MCVILAPNQTFPNPDHAGETGTGKTTFLSLIANVLAGRSPEQYQDVHDRSNEAGGSANQSQTNSARLYEFTSNDGVKIKILDTPGLADTRGLLQDDLHKANIAKTIGESIAAIDGVLILINGTVSRLGVATDYALSTLTSILPRTLSDNIGVLFTNVSDPLSWNSTLPQYLQDIVGDNQWQINNPVALWNNYSRMIGQSGGGQKVRPNMRQFVNEAHDRALDIIACIVNWLDGLAAQSTKDIMELNKQLQQINREMEPIDRWKQLPEEKKRLQTVRESAYRHGQVCVSMQGTSITLIDFQTMWQYTDYTSIVTSKVWVQESTPWHNVLCTLSNCYSNCHIDCRMRFTLDPRDLLRCSAMSGRSCVECGHHYSAHRHYHYIWEQEERHEEKIDRTAERRYHEARRNKAQDERSIANLERNIQRLNASLNQHCSSLSRFIKSYEAISLTGSFSGQLKKSISAAEMKLEASQVNSAGQAEAAGYEKTLEYLRKKLELVELSG